MFPIVFENLEISEDLGDFRKRSEGISSMLQQHSVHSGHVSKLS